MTIEELSIEATDQENFSHDGEVLVKVGDSIPHPVVSAKYNPETKQLILTI